jgi:hypothetical protein
MIKTALKEYLGLLSTAPITLFDAKYYDPNSASRRRLEGTATSSSSSSTASRRLANEAYGVTIKFRLDMAGSEEAATVRSLLEASGAQAALEGHLIASGMPLAAGSVAALTVAEPTALGEKEVVVVEEGGVSAAVGITGAIIAGVMLLGLFTWKRQKDREYAAIVAAGGSMADDKSSAYGGGGNGAPGGGGGGGGGGDTRQSWARSARPSTAARAKPARPSEAFARPSALAGGDEDDKKLMSAHAERDSMTMAPDENDDEDDMDNPLHTV